MPGRIRVYLKIVVRMDFGRRLQKLAPSET
jgi:hypothetical protein